MKTTGKISAFSSLVAHRKGVRAGLPPAAISGNVQLLESQYQAHKCAQESRMNELRAQALAAQESKRQKELDAAEIKAKLDAEILALLALPMAEQCHRIRQDVGIFFSMQRPQIKTEHIQAAIEFARTDLARQVKSLERQHRPAALKLWSGGLIAKILKGSPASLHTPEMVIQLATGRTRPSRSYSPTNENASASLVSLKAIFGKHPLLDDALAQRLVKTNPWLFFHLPAKLVNPALTSIAESGFQQQGCIPGSIDHYRGVHLQQPYPSLGEYLAAPLTHEKKWRRMANKSESTEIREQQVAAETTAKAAKALAHVKNMQLMAAETADEKAVKAANRLAAKNECEFAAARSVVLGSALVESMDRGPALINYQLLYDEKSRSISLICQRGEWHRLYNCVLMPDRKSTPNLVICHRGSNGHLWPVGTGVFNAGRVEFNSDKVPNLNFYCVMDTKPDWFHEPSAQRLMAHRVNQPHIAVMNEPEEVEEGLTAEDLSRLRGDFPMDAGYARPRG